MKLLIRGIIPPLITPLKGENELDEKGLENLLEYLITGGVHGIFLLGTTGEATNLSYELRKQLIKRTCEIVNKRVTVLVGITDTAITGSLEIAKFSASAGADALVIAPPYYLPMTQNEFIEYLEDLTPRLSLPFLLYNMPSCTKFDMTLETIKKAKELGAIGIKDSSGDLAKLYSLIEEFKDSPEFSIISGTELFIPEAITFAGHGAIAGGANLFPKLFVELYDATLVNNIKRVTVLREMVIQIGKKIYNVGTTSSKYIKSLKCALSVIGICNDYVASPFRKFNDQEKRQIEQNLKEIKLSYPEFYPEIKNLTD